MELFSWLFKKRKSAVVIDVRGRGSYAFDLVGESECQSALENICGGKSQDGHKKIVVAMLVPEGRKAIRVEINGMTVGYLNKENARQFRQRLKKAGRAGARAYCSAMITGGRDRGGEDRLDFVVKLDLP
jgi:hypothetical protein